VPRRIWGPAIVIGVYGLAGGLIGADVALWPWDVPMSLPIAVSIGAIVGFLAGVFIVWAIRHAEDID
jgi:hypothetical protein